MINDNYGHDSDLTLYVNKGMRKAQGFIANSIIWKSSKFKLISSQRL